MRNVYTIQQCIKEKNEWICNIKEDINISTLQPAGQVLTDSDKLAFVYLVVENDDYSYIQFSKNIWPSLLTIVQNKDKVFIKNEKDKIELIDFALELEALLFNIEGNGNYGEIFVSTVEKVFEPFYKGE